MKRVFEVEIFNLEIDDKYFSFDYTITINGDKNESGSYDGDHYWGGDLENFREMLLNGEIYELALEDAL